LPLWIGHFGITAIRKSLQSRETVQDRFVALLADCERGSLAAAHVDAVDITAPGEFVPRANRAPQNGGSPIDVHGGQGTSFAVALTAGVAALWIGHFGITAIRKSLQCGETVQDRFVALLQETSWQPPGFDTSEFGAGIVDTVKLLKHALQPQAAKPEMVFAIADPLRSVRTMLAELAPGSMEAVADASAGPPNSRRYAAELSHLGLLKRKKMMSGGVALERVEVDTPPSETLQRELTEAGRTDLLAALN
jgi:serine protease